VTDIQQLQAGCDACQKNIDNMVRHLGQIAEYIKLPQDSEVLANLLKGREVAQKALKGEHDKLKRLQSQAAMLELMQ